MSEASRRAAAEQYVRDLDHREANRVVFLAGWDAAMVAADTAIERAVEGERERCIQVALSHKVIGQRAGNIADVWDSACLKIAAALRTPGEKA